MPLVFNLTAVLIRYILKSIYKQSADIKSLNVITKTLFFLYDQMTSMIVIVIVVVMKHPISTIINSITCHSS